MLSLMTRTDIRGYSFTIITLASPKSWMSRFCADNTMSTSSQNELLPRWGRQGNTLATQEPSSKGNGLFKRKRLIYQISLAIYCVSVGTRFTVCPLGIASVGEGGATLAMQSILRRRPHRERCVPHTLAGPGMKRKHPDLTHQKLAFFCSL